MNCLRGLLGRLFARKVETLETVDPLTGYSLWAEQYASERNPVLELNQRALCDLLPSLKSKRVLDVGCGTGRVTSILADGGAACIVGIDFSFSMLEQASTQLRSSPNTHLIAAAGQRLPFADNSFDLVTCSLMISHLEDLFGVVAELARLIKPGGRMLISEFHPFWHLLGWDRSFQKQKNGQVARIRIRYFRYLYEDYFQAFKAAKLEIEAIREPLLDKSVKQFFEGSRQSAANYKKFVGYPVVLCFRLRRT